MSARFASALHRPRHLLHRSSSASRVTTWPLRGPSSILAKSLRDSRRAWLLAGFGMGLFVLMYGASISTNYPTPASRKEAVDSLMAVKAVGALTSLPINAETLGGFLSWRVTSLVPLVFGVWSVIALSGTLAGESRAGTMEVLGSVPLARRRIALEKMAAHLGSLVIAGAILTAMVWLTGLMFARLPGDDISLAASLEQTVGLVLASLVAGAFSFALAPFLGRAAAAGLGTTALFAAFLVEGYRSVAPGLEGVSHLSWFTWLARERPLAGSHDVAPLFLTAALCAILLAVGVASFERRDIGAAVRLRSVSLPGRRFLLRGPARATFLEMRPAALGWGLAIGVYALFAALSSPSYLAQFAGDAQSVEMMDRFFPGMEWQTTPGMLQFMFFVIGVPFMALAGATLVHGLASVERERRLDLLLSSSGSRACWLIAGGAGVFAALAMLTLIIAAGAALGTAANGDDAAQPFLGTWVGGLYAAALAGVGMAVFGLGRPGLAGATTAGLAVCFVLIDVLGGSLKLPGALLSLSLSRHLGQPMAGVYDWPGMAAATAIAIAGLLIGAWGIRRRDLAT